MQQLGVVARLFPDIEAGRKLSTIRWRESRIVPGHMRYVCDGDPDRTAVVWVTRCTDMPLSQAAAYLGKAEEWPREIMLRGMREHYPRIQWADVVQIVEHLSPAESAARADSPG